MPEGSAILGSPIKRLRQVIVGRVARVIHICITRLTVRVTASAFQAVVSRVRFPLVAPSLDKASGAAECWNVCTSLNKDITAKGSGHGVKVAGNS